MLSFIIYSSCFISFLESRKHWRSSTRQKQLLPLLLRPPFHALRLCKLHYRYTGQYHRPCHPQLRLHQYQRFHRTYSLRCTARRPRHLHTSVRGRYHRLLGWRLLVRWRRLRLRIRRHRRMGMPMGRQAQLVDMARMDSRGMVCTSSSSSNSNNSNNNSISNTHKEGVMLGIRGMLLSQCSRLPLLLLCPLRCRMRWLGFLRSRRWVLLLCINLSSRLFFSFVATSHFYCVQVYPFSGIFRATFPLFLSLELGDNFFSNSTSFPFYFYISRLSLCVSCR